MLRRPPILGAVFAALLASCATSSMVTQHSNPDYVGKPFKSVMVVAVTTDDLVRRTFEDRMVALLGQRGLRGIPSYSTIGATGKVDEAELRRAVAASGVEAVLITRVTRVDRSSGTLPGATVGVGFYGYWEVVNLPPQQVNGPSWTVSETRLFDAKNGVLAWTGVMDTRENDDLGAALMQYIKVVFDAMVRDRVL